MSIERGQAVVLVVGGMLIGAGVTTLVLKKHYQKIADAEIASVKTVYKEKEQSFYKSGVTQEDVDNASSIITIPEIVDLPSDPLATRKNYNHIEPSEERKAQVGHLIDGLGYVGTKEVPPVPVLRPEPDPDEPYVISVDQFMGNDEEFEQITLTYYAGDGHVADDMEELVEDVAGALGLNNLHKFGERSGNDDTVYIRNMERKADFEVLRDYRSYGKDMLGMEDWEPDVKAPKPPKNPKFRGE